MDLSPTVVLVAVTTGPMALAFTPVVAIWELMAAAMAMALPLLELESAVELLFVSLEAKEAGIATATPLELTMVKSPSPSVLGTPPASTPVRKLVVVTGEPTGAPALPFKMGKPFHWCVSEIRTISCLSC